MAGSTKGIIITGPESVGKTTLAEYISGEFNGAYVAEFAREYIHSLNRNYTYSDIEKIAKQQLADFEALKQTSSVLNVFDTYLVITKIWFVWYAGKYPIWIDDKIAETTPMLYLLCKPDIEWEADTVRENGGEARWRLFEEYKSELEHFGLNYKIVEGKGKNRTHLAHTFVKEYIESM